MKNIPLSIILAMLAACTQVEQKSNSGDSIAAIQSVMDAQESAWNRGDIDGFMLGYWNSDSLRFIGKRGITFGWQKTLENYKRGYPNANAMGQLTFTNLSMELTGDTTAYVIGKWELFRSSDTLSGHYSLLWKNIGGKWLITADHSS